jgi:hypothetical protein
LDGVDLAPSRSARRRSSTVFGFSWSNTVSLQNPPMMWVGFPWILSSESSLINGLLEIFVGKFFVALLPRNSHRAGVNHRFCKAKVQGCSWDKLSLISDFLQAIAARALPFGPPPFKRKSL